MCIKVTSSMLTGIANRMTWYIELEKYYLTEEWISRRVKYMQKVDSISEVSGHPADVVHHLTYPFKTIKDFSKKELYGMEKDNQLLALTNDEHKVVHHELQHLAHKPRKLLKELKLYFGY
jgi:hypothetical protein